MSTLKIKSVNWSKVDEIMQAATVSSASEVSARSQKGVSGTELKQAGKFAPGAVLHVALGRDVLLHKAYGARTLRPDFSEMAEDTVFDVSSLTKPLVTTTLVMHLVDRGLLDLDQKVTRLLQGFSVHGKERMSVRHLLAHCSGYPAHVPFYKRISEADRAARLGFMATSDAAESVFRELLRAKLENLPGKVRKYSDLGFMLLGNIIESVSGTRLPKLAEKVIFRPLKMRSSGFIDLSMIRRKSLVPDCDAIAPSNDCSWRRRMICGEVQDENAWAMGGIAGHAGLFTTASDIEKILLELHLCCKGQGTLIQQGTMREFWKEESFTGSGSYLGWDAPEAGGSQAGNHFPKSSVGHLGFTGCSIWMLPETGLRVILLSNRLHPDYDDNDHIKVERPLIHDTVLESLGVMGAAKNQA